MLGPNRGQVSLSLSWIDKQTRAKRSWGAWDRDKGDCAPSPQPLSTSFAYSNPLCSIFWMSLTSDLHPTHPHLEASVTDLGEMSPLLLRGTVGSCATTCFFLTLEETRWDSPAEVKRCWLPSQLSAELQTPGDILRIYRSPYLFP